MKLDGGRFEVRMQETHLDELFTTFDHDESNPYYTPEEIEEKVSKAIGSSIPQDSRLHRAGCSSRSQSGQGCKSQDFRLTANKNNAILLA